MMGLDTIRSMSREAALKSARDNNEPFLVEQEDIEDWKVAFEAGRLRFPFPNIGDYRPDGWELGEELFVDSSGFGREDEPALTIEQLLDKLQSGKGYAITEVGQFQLYVGEFEKVKPIIQSPKLRSTAVVNALDFEASHN